MSEPTRFEKRQEEIETTNWRQSFNNKVVASLPSVPEPEEDEDVPDPVEEPVSYRLYQQGFKSEEHILERISEAEAEGDWQKSSDLKAALSTAHKWEA